MKSKAIATFMAILAISIMSGSAIAQTTTPAHECIDLSQQGQTETAYRLTNECSATIRISGRDESNGLCQAFDSQDGEDEIASSGTFNIAAPAQICVEYADSATQTASGYPGCGTLSDCGTGGNTITQTHPTKPTATIAISPAGTLDIDEGSSGTFTVALSAAPIGSAVVTLSKTNSDITLSPTSLTFTLGNYNQAQTVTVSAAQDGDAVDDQDTITLSATGGISAANATKSVAVGDSKPAGNIVIVSPLGTLLIDEGTSANLRIALSVAPSANVTVALSKTNSDITLSPTSLTFTPGNYDQAQIVAVSAAQDGDAVDDQDTITLSAGGGIVAANVTKSVSVDDDEPPPGEILITPAGALSVEEGGSAVLSVSLSVSPDDDTQVTLSKTNADITLSPTSLTFTSDNYDQAQTVSVSAANDDDAADDRDTITLSAGGGIDADDASKLVIVDDDDAPAAPLGKIVTGPFHALTIDEGGSVDMTVVLSDAPNADVTVAITKSNSDITLSSASLTFTVDNYNQAQTVTVSAAEDDDDVDDQDTITLSASGGIDADNVNRSISVDDNDKPPSGLMVLVPATEILVKEGESGTLTVALNVAPNADVSVVLSSPDADITLTPASLTFTSDNHDQAQTVTVAIGHDDDATDDEALITLTASGGIVAPNETMTVLMEDDDGAAEGIDINIPSLRIREGRSGRFSVRLESEPSADVVISFSFSSIVGPQGLTISPSSLTFTSGNWGVYQDVTVSAAQDDDDQSYAAEMILSASDGYPAANARILVEVTDDEADPDYLEILIEPGPDQTVDINEGDSFDYRVSLSVSPGSSSIVTFSPSSSKITVNPYFLTFTPENFSQKQTMTVRALVDDDLIHNNYEFKAQLGPDVYAEIVRREIRVLDRTEPEPEGPFLSLEAVDGSRPSVNEGETEQFHILLGYQPETDVQVALSTDSPEIITLNTNTISIPRDDWQTPHVFNVSAAADDDALNVDVRVNATSTAGGQEESASMLIVVKDTTGAEWAQQAQAPAIPPSNSLDHATLRVRCKQDTDCDAYLFCTSQDGEVFEGVLDPIPANGTLTLTAAEIEEITSGSWAGKGRLNCEIRGDGSLEAQVWTRSGDGVLVNNSPVIVSRPFEGLHVASIESISSPLTNEITNVRIRCNAPSGEHCTDTKLYCYDDMGVLRQVDLGTIDRYSVRHLQSSELSDLISYVWRGLGLSCDATSEQPFSVQVLTRTGSGVLVNNSGCN